MDDPPVPTLAEAALLRERRRAIPASADSPGRRDMVDQFLEAVRLVQARGIGLAEIAAAATATSPAQIRAGGGSPPRTPSRAGCDGPT